MDLLDLLKLMFRRWYVSVPLVALTAGAALALGTSIQPEYKTSAAVLLVPPTLAAAPPAPGASPQPGNPWLRVGENAMAQAVQIRISAHDARRRVAAAGGDPDYQVGLVNRSSIITAEITAPDQASARATVTELIRLIHDEVAGQQAPYNPRPGEQISTEVLDPGSNITQSRSNVLRAQLVVGAIGLLVASAGAVLCDALIRRRTGRLRMRPPVPARTDGEGTGAVVATRPVTPVPAGTANPPVPAGSVPGQPAPAATGRVDATH